MQLISTAFEDGGFIPLKYTCEGDNISPPLLFTQVSQETQSIALMVTDPDAPTKDFVHWLIWNIDPAQPALAEGEVPTGSIEGVNGFGAIGWGGPCPPSGIHRYIFEAYALGERLELKSGSTKSHLLDALRGRILNKTTLIGRYALQDT